MNSLSRILGALVCVLCLLVFAEGGRAQSNSNQLAIFKNYFVTGDYVVGGWIKGASDGKLATGTITIPDGKQPPQANVPSSVPVGADIVAAYLYWETVESTNPGSQTGVNGTFNGYAISGANPPNQNAPTSWSGGGCAGNNNGSKTLHVYRADVKPYLPVDLNSKSPTF